MILCIEFNSLYAEDLSASLGALTISTLPISPLIKYVSVKESSDLTNIPELIKRIYGKNFNPAVRALETTQGIVDSSARIRLASSLSDSLVNQGKAARANTPEGAALQLGIDDDMVPLVTGMDFSGTPTPINKNAAFILDTELVDDALLNTYVPKKDAELLKSISEAFGFLGSTMFKPQIFIVFPWLLSFNTIFFCTSIANLQI